MYDGGNCNRWTARANSGGTFSNSLLWNSESWFSGLWIGGEAIFFKM
jgi:hypothetical protein